MKRFTAFIAAVLLVVLSTASVFASAYPSYAARQQTKISVSARYIANAQPDKIPIDENGQGTTILPDGTEITVSGIMNTDWQLFIVPIQDSSALDWIGSILSDKTAKFFAFHIYFMNSSGVVKSADSITVTVKLPEELTSPVGYSLTKKGTLSNMSISAKDGKITFQTDGNPYFMIGEQLLDSTSADSGKAPKTGDTANLALWLMLLFTSGGIIVCILFLFVKKKKTSE